MEQEAEDEYFASKDQQPLKQVQVEQPITGIDAVDIHEKVMEACGSTNLGKSIKAKVEKAGEAEAIGMGSRVSA